MKNLCIQIKIYPQERNNAIKIYIYIHTHTKIYTYIHTHTDIYTHTHTYIYIYFFPPIWYLCIQGQACPRDWAVVPKNSKLNSRETQ